MNVNGQTVASIGWRHVAEGRDAVVMAVNPAVYSGEDCPYHKPNHVVTMAYGMRNSFHEVKADDIAALRNTLIRHFASTFVALLINSPMSDDIFIFDETDTFLIGVTILKWLSFLKTNSKT